MTIQAWELVNPDSRMGLELTIYQSRADEAKRNGIQVHPLIRAQPRLSVGKLHALAVEAQVAFNLDKYDSFEMALCVAIEDYHGVPEA